MVDEEEPNTREHRILGVGRLIRFHGKTEAEVAILVSDEYQNQGLGGELLSRTLKVAREERLTRISAEILPDNIQVLEMFKHAGFSLRSDPSSSSIRATLDLA